MRGAKHKYGNHRFRAQRRGILFNMTFDEWMQIWISSGKWSLRGRGADKYCMCRYGDMGPYEMGNVYIDTNKHNSATGQIGRKQSPEHIAKRASALKGKPSGMKGKIPWNKGTSRSKLHLDGESK